MLKLAEAEDQERILHFLKEESSFNTFMIGDILTYGFSSNMQKVYINEGELDIIVLVYFTTMLVYQKSNTVHDLSFIMNMHDIKTIMGKETILDMYDFQGYTKTIKRFMELHSPLQKTDAEYIIAKETDAEELAEFYMKIEEFRHMYHGKEEVQAMIANRIHNKEGRHFFIKENGEIIAQINSAAENPYSAIIGGVGTLKEYRNQGYASSLLKSLCSVLQKEHIMPCLFYDNEAAGRIYQSNGFEYIGNYAYYDRG